MNSVPLVWCGACMYMIFKMMVAVTAMRIKEFAGCLVFILLVMAWLLQIIMPKIILCKVVANVL